MATSSANEKLATSVWFIGVVSGMGRKIVVARLRKQVGNAMAWHQLILTQESFRFTFWLRIGRRLRLVTLKSGEPEPATMLRIGRRLRLVTLHTSPSRNSPPLRIGRRLRLVTL